MCNTFGGIVLMAVVMALLSREVDVSAAAAARSSANADTAEMLERRVAKAEDDLIKAEALQSTLDKQSMDPALEERVKLAAERRRLQQQLQALRAAPHDAPASDRTSDPGLLANGLHVELASLAGQKVDLENARTTLDENIARLQRRKTDLAAQSQSEKDKSVRKVRLPKERASIKQPFYVIMRYGRAYPRAVFRNGVTVENDVTIQRTMGNDKLLLEPRAGRGLDPAADKMAVTQLLQEIPTGSFYVAFIVYQDSFSAFNAVKAQAAQIGLEYGWDAFANGRPLIFTEHGEKPAPPL